MTRRHVLAVGTVTAALVLIGCWAFADLAAAAGNPRQGTFSGQVGIGGGRTLFMRCAGRGRPTVIMEAGNKSSSATWTHVEVRQPSVFQDVARFTHVCIYDRPGTVLSDGRLSRSTPVPMPRTLPSIAADLHPLLISAGLRVPVVLVGHSFGGVIVRYFAQTYRNEVRGMILVDALGSSIASLLGPVVASIRPAAQLPLRPVRQSARARDDRLYRRHPGPTAGDTAPDAASGDH